MSISALPVVARILTELDLMRRNIAQVTVAAAMINDLVGWILLGTLSGIVTLRWRSTSSRPAARSSRSRLFFAFALTLGQRWTDTALRISRQVSAGLTGPLTVTMVVALLAATVTQAIGVEAVLGAFVAGIVLGRSPYQRPEVRRTIELLSAAVFAPIFFATAGIYVDLGALATGSGLFWAVVIILVATFTKLGRQLRRGADGADEPRRRARDRRRAERPRGHGDRAGDHRVRHRGVQPGRLHDHRADGDGHLAGRPAAAASRPARRPARRRRGRAAPARGAALGQRRGLDLAGAAAHARGAELGARREVIDLVLQPEAVVTVLAVHDPRRPGEECTCAKALDEIVPRFDERQVERRRHTSTDAVEAILQEAELGYGLLALGMTEEFTETHELSGVLHDLVLRARIPIVLVRHGTRSRRVQDARRVLVPSSGVRLGRAAEEVGAVLAARLDAELDLVHVVSRVDRGVDGASRLQVRTAPPDAGERTGQQIVDQAVLRAERFGARVTGDIRSGDVAARVLLEAADDHASRGELRAVRARRLPGLRPAVRAAGALRPADPPGQLGRGHRPAGARPRDAGPRRPRRGRRPARGQPLSASSTRSASTSTRSGAPTCSRRSRRSTSPSATRRASPRSDPPLGRKLTPRRKAQLNGPPRRRSAPRTT
jgi:hypothetical protein